MSWLWHGLNRSPLKRANQCFYTWHCVVCFLRTCIDTVRSGRRLRR